MIIEIRINGAEGVDDGKSFGISVPIGKDYKASILNARLIINRLVCTLCGDPEFVEKGDMTNLDFVNRYLEAGNRYIERDGLETRNLKEYNGNWAKVQEK